MKKLIKTLVAGATILGVIPVNECWSMEDINEPVQNNEPEKNQFWI